MYFCPIPGDVKVVLNEGMPTHKNPFDKGRLIIHFSVSVTFCSANTNGASCRSEWLSASVTVMG